MTGPAGKTGPAALPPGVGAADLDLIRQSPLFDAAWYADRNPDIAFLGMDPAVHYLWLGGRLGRNPSPGFDARAYLALNGDVATTGMNPLLHYLRFGRDEGRWVTPPAMALPAPLPSTLPQSDPGKRRAALPGLNWVMNPDNLGWAYGNNAQSLAARLPGFDHVFDGFGITTDVALYFDIRIWLMRGTLATRNVLRVGGPRPIRLAYGDDRDRLRADLAAFDAVIVLNQSLFDDLSPLHPAVHLVPNALDLALWRPVGRPSQRRAGRPFTLGFAGNLSSGNERAIKGYDLVEQVAQALNLPLVHFGKGQDQIPRDAMRERFYGAIDCLVHPVDAGKEGCSNVIMEALALGVPVITTRNAGFHAERIADGDGLLYATRDPVSLLAAITRLQGDPGLADAMAGAGRRFAEAHHDITRTARLYARILLPGTATLPALHFVPFWEPPGNFASSRLRCLQPAALLADSALVRPVVEGRDLPPAPAGPVIVSQLATDATLAVLQDAPDVPLIHDLCDRYHVDDRIIGGVNARARFHDLAARADVITVSTPALKREITALALRKPVVWLPDGIDYRDSRDARPTDPAGPVLWYGNPGRGNFDAARWMIDHVAAIRPVRLISNRGYFLHRAETEPDIAHYAAICTDWAEGSFIADMRACGLCLIAHSPDEATKSANRLITAVMNGLPVIVANAPACAALLRAGGMGWAVVTDAAGLDAALARLDDAGERARYLAAMQEVVEAHHGDTAIRNRYEALLTDHLTPGPRQAIRPIRALFVSHNLYVGEGAPTSLMQVVTGIKAAHPDIEPVVFATLGGGLADAYAAAGVPVILPLQAPPHGQAAHIIAQRQDTMVRAFTAALTDHAIDVVVVNTATSLWFANLAEEMGVPALAVIRESSDEHVQFAFGHPDVMAGCRKGLDRARRVIFVAEETRKLWRAHHDLGRTAVIPNGIDMARLAPAGTQDRAALRAELGLTADDLVLLCVGSVNARKAQGDIVAALARLPRDLWGRVRLVMVGARPSDYLDALRAGIAALDPDLAARIRIEAETPDIGPWYGAADVFVFASRNESYPRVIIEAMAFGLPIVSSAIFGTQEQIADGQSGLLFPPGDVAALAECLARVIGDAGLRAALAAGAAERVWELTSHDEMVHRHYIQIRQVLDADPA